MKHNELINEKRLHNHFITLGEVFKVKSGINLSAKNMIPGPYKVYGGNGVSGYHNKFNFKESKIIIGRVGAHCGNVHLTDSNSWITDNALYIDQYYKEIDKGYLVYCLKDANLNHYASQSGQPLISGGRIKDVKIPLPPLPTQKKIAAILDAADAYRQKTKALIEKYDELTQSLFLDMFGDPVVNEKGWEKKTLVDVVSPDKYSLKRGPFGGALKKEIFQPSGIKVYEQRNAIKKSISEGKYFIDKRKYQEMKAFTVNSGDFIVSCSGTIGEIYRIPNNAPFGIINQALMKIQIDEGIIHPAFFESLFNFYIRDHIFISGSKGSGLKNVASMKVIKSSNFIVPNMKKQMEYVERLGIIKEQKSQAQESLQKAEELFKSLLGRAFKGGINFY